MNRSILIAKAWPYANGPLHIGHLAGLLGADILARYFRLRGDDVLFVSGTDCHGTPIMNRALDEGTTPQAIVDKYHDQFSQNFLKLGFTHDFYALTATPHHHEVVKAFIKRLYEKGYLVPKKETQLFCVNCNQFLVDRLVEGCCPYCGESGARGDQCESCGKTYEAIELAAPHCKKCEQSAQKRDSEHLYFDLPQFQIRLEELLDQSGFQWRENAQKATKSWLKKGLHDRAVTRDLEWGVNVPIKDFEDKKIYVWFDAVLGYLSTSIAHCGGSLEGGEWEKWWRPSKNLLHYYVHGKDNIPFHTIIFPAMLMGYGNLALPTHIISSEYLNLPAGKKFSKSSGYGVTLPQFFDLADKVAALEIDSLRFFLSARGPETKDSSFSWRELAQLHNSELVNKFGNLVSRAVSFATKHFDAKVPEFSNISSAESKLFAQLIQIYQTVGGHIEKGEFRSAAQVIIELMRETNALFDIEKPWDTINTNPQKAKNTINIAFQVLFNLRTLLCPFIPFGVEKLDKILRVCDIPKKWEFQILPPGFQLGKNEHVFTRIKESQLPND